MLHMSYPLCKHVHAFLTYLSKDLTSASVKLKFLCLCISSTLSASKWSYLTSLLYRKRPSVAGKLSTPLCPHWVTLLTLFLLSLPGALVCSFCSLSYLFMKCSSLMTKEISSKYGLHSPDLLPIWYDLQCVEWRALDQSFNALSRLEDAKRLNRVYSHRPCNSICTPKWLQTVSNRDVLGCFDSCFNKLAGYATQVEVTLHIGCPVGGNNTKTSK
jgi:hypothetical protein